MGRPPAPTHHLATIQGLVKAGVWTATKKAFLNAAQLEFDRTDVQTCVLQLDEADFYKTMESETVPGTWQDVYKPTYLGVAVYLKLQISSEPKAIVIQFKKDNSR